ncbi:hypothetical protein ACSNOI_39495 [Actinomadura kijaniata]|uniref:hypothetical protein n=1 Tax=Actinomadura kijaniata TaxID=46161 RepID=UPI003F1C4664
MFDEKTQETLRRLLDLAEHPNTSASERSLAFAKIRAVVGSPDTTRRASVNAARDAALLARLRPLTARVDDELVEEVHGDLYAFGSRHRVMGEVAEELAEILQQRATAPRNRRARYDELVRSAAWRLTYLLERGDTARRPAWRRTAR